MADRPTISWDETAPANLDFISLGDDRLREMKTQIREVIEVDHKMGDTGQASDWGYHKQVTLIEQASNPTALAGAVTLYTKEADGKTELFSIDEDSNVQQLTSGGQFIGGMNKEVRMWSGTLAGIGAGWALCDGAGGRPNLIAKFIRGIATAVTNPGATGGLDSNSPVNLYHNHGFVGLDGAHGHRVAYKAGSSGSVKAVSKMTNNGYAYSQFLSGEGWSHIHILNNWGNGSANIENRPAYFELAFIART